MNTNFQTPVTAKDLAESFGRCSVDAVNAGVSFEGLTALIESANAVSKASGTEIGKSLKGLDACHACYGD